MEELILDIKGKGECVRWDVNEALKTYKTWKKKAAAFWESHLGEMNKK